MTHTALGGMTRAMCFTWNDVEADGNVLVFGCYMCKERVRQAPGSKDIRGFVYALKRVVPPCMILQKLHLAYNRACCLLPVAHQPQHHACMHQHTISSMTHTQAPTSTIADEL